MAHCWQFIAPFPLPFNRHAVVGIFLALPYPLTLVLLAAGAGRIRAPAADGVPYDPEDLT